MSIEDKDVRYVADLARLSLTDKECELYTGQLKRILEYVEKLSEVDTTGVEPTTYTVPRARVVREDSPGGSIPREEALGNAPESDEGCFKVPKVIE